MKQSTESFILNSARKAIGVDRFGQYFNNFGTCGLGKTFEYCVNKTISENEHGFRSIETKSNEKMDIILERGQKRIGIQIKIHKEYNRVIGLSRIDENCDSDTSINIGSKSYKNILTNECRKNKIDICYILFISTSDGIMNLRKFCHMVDNELIFENVDRDENIYKYSNGNTSFRIDQEKFPLVGKRKFKPLNYKESKIVVKKRQCDIYDIKELSQKALIEFNKFDKLYLGKRWGDKGLAWEKYLIDYLMVEGINIKQLGSRDIGDATIKDVGIIQIKYYDTKTSSDQLKNFCRSSKKEDCTFIEPSFFDNNIHKSNNDSSEIRREDVDNRIQSLLLEHNERLFFLLEGAGYNQKVNLYQTSELLDDLTIRHFGSFLSKNKYKSNGGKNGNQSHFKIKTKGLLSVDNEQNQWFDK